jgi:hypothetical protein
LFFGVVCVLWLGFGTVMLRKSTSMDPVQNGAQVTDSTSGRDSEIAKEWISLAAEFVTVPAAAVFGFLTGARLGPESAAETK